MNFRYATLRKLTIGLVAMGLALSATAQFGTARAHAATAFTAGTLTARGSCDSFNHTRRMTSDITLDPTRFPKGAYVYSRYGYYAVNTLGQRITDITYTDWILSLAASSVYGSGPNALGNQAFALPANFTHTWGEWIVMANVAVWNG